MSQFYGVPSLPHPQELDFNETQLTFSTFVPCEKEKSQWSTAGPADTVFKSQSLSFEVHLELDTGTLPLLGILSLDHEFKRYKDTFQGESFFLHFSPAKAERFFVIPLNDHDSLKCVKNFVCGFPLRDFCTSRSCPLTKWCTYTQNVTNYDHDATMPSLTQNC